MKSIQKLATVSAVLSALFTSVASADPVKLNMPSVYPGSLTQLGTAGVRVADTVNLISGGEVKIKFFEPGALVPALEIFDAVSNGSVDAGWSTSGYWGSKNSALNIFATVPFGPQAGEYLAWMWYGDGDKLKNEIYNRHGIQSITCGIHSPETSGWFKKEINSPEDLKGLKMRFYGIGAKVMQKLGVDTQLLAGGDIFPALERGTIDATEFSMPAIDLKLGFYNAAKHNYFPGWHQQSTIQELLVNKKKWDNMTERQQAIIETTCRSNIATQYAEGEAIQAPALAAMKEKGVITHRWNDEMLDAIRNGWVSVLAEEKAANREFESVWNNLEQFREEYATWKNLGYL
ncbi:TRAP transporter substrate-binding protein [Enterovibrio norvegicus]|uniref:TRAP transporter substrate-binding protein n=1 Tax=Enterovibrio norvegicus TaxID=188144 RepID=UPI000C84599F|nr:TRAP transporter substrate-binding protein [Enterovibrio norvegicus]MCC4800578.1 TRAP transporter substrate-binding protein [Enterovibrio norvegicus]TKF20006.1 TRAP transporter substrate-binding protein [Enterovibrio norvegicus]TKF36538.1 TRAP transporter substrate-binding protein [Enterovibrio norvegicus]